jgi:transcriptional regulator with PAS, ATPase and Fis domain
MPKGDWIKEFPGAVTVCDAQGIIVEMNEKSVKTFEKDGGRELLGKNLLDCHSPASNVKIRELLATGATNVYTIEKNGVKKLIYQAPWIENGELKGLVELSLEVPFEMPHFLR